MVVDDEEEISRLLTLKLRQSGYDVINAYDAVQATQLAIRERPDLCILDIGMPGGSGYTVADRISKNCQTVGTPLVFLTGHASAEEEAKAKHIGAFALLAKPFNSELLLDTIVQALASVGK